MQPGDVVIVQVCHADGQAYRRWQSTIEEISDETVITMSPPGKPIEDVGKGIWHSRWYVRRYLWRKQPYSLLEMYHPDGQLAQIYIDVASPVIIAPGLLSFIDYELDVICQPGEAAQIVDELEFAEAIVKYGYTPEFQAYCRQAALAACAMAEGWSPRGIDLGQVSKMAVRG
jgi:protein associated with RNAse G/E